MTHNLNRKYSKEQCLSIVDRLYIHRMPNVLIALDLLDWIDKTCFDKWYVELTDFEIEFGFINPIDNLNFCNKWGRII